MGRFCSSALFRLPVVILAFAVILGRCDGNKTGAFDSDSNKKVKLTDIPELSLRQNHWTTARRGAPIQQLRCLGGTANCATHALPKEVHCFNRGTDGIDVQWECKAELDENFKLGAIDVSCEGYDYPDDPYIVQGSCGLRYFLHVRSSRERKGKTSLAEFLSLFVFVAIYTLISGAVIICLLDLVDKAGNVVYERCFLRIWRAVFPENNDNKNPRPTGKANGDENQEVGDASKTSSGTDFMRLRSGRLKPNLNSKPDDDSDSSEYSSSGGQERTFFSSTVNPKRRFTSAFRLNAYSPVRSYYRNSPPNWGGGIASGYRSSSYGRTFGSSGRSYISTSFGGTSRR